MFPGNLSLLSLLMGSGAQPSGGIGGFGNMVGGGQDYWNRVNATRQPGEDNASVWFRGLLPQSAWPTQWRDAKYGYSEPAPAKAGDRSDQSNQGNQPDTGNSMAPPGQVPPGGPDNSQMSGYDPNTVSPGYNPPPWMRSLMGNYTGARRDPRQGLQMGLLGLAMMQPRQQAAPRPMPWI